MATRIYLPSSGTAPASPAYDANWDDTGFGARLPCYREKQSTSMTAVNDNDPGVADTDHLLRQWVGEPLQAQTITAQTVKLQIRTQQSNAKDNLYTSVSIRVCSNDGSTIRGTLVALTRDDTEWNTTYQNRSFSTTSTQVVAQANDRIVIEIGGGGDPGPPSGTHNADISIGDDSGTDLPEDDSEWNAYNPWVEFANTLDFVGDPLVVTPAAASAVASSVNPTAVLGDTTASPTAASAVASTVDPTVAIDYPNYSISTSVAMCSDSAFSSGFYGPFCDTNNNLYVILLDDTNLYELECWKSTDNGETWAEVDSTNKPTTAGTDAIGSIATQQLGDTIHIATLTDSPTAYIHYHTFQMSDHTSGSDQWGTTDEQVHSYTEADLAWEYGCNIGVQPDGDIIIVTAAPEVSTFEQVRYHYNTGSGWVTDQPLLTGSYDNVTGGAHTVAIDPNDDSIWISAKEESGRDHILWNLAEPDSTTGSGQTMFSGTTVGDRNYQGARLVAYNSSGSSMVAFATINVETSYQGLFQLAINGNLQSEFLISTDVLWNYPDGHHVGHMLAVNQTDIYYTFIKDSDQFIYYRVSDNGASFGNANQITTSGSASVLSTNIYTRAGNNWLGVVYQLGDFAAPTDVRFLSIDLGAAPSEDVTVAPSAASTVASTVAPTVVKGSTTAAPSAAQAVASTTDPTVVKGPLAITPAPASAVASSVDPTTVYGSVTVSPAASSAVVSTVDPGVVQTSQTITPTAASAVVSTANPDVVYGSLSIQPDASYAVASTVAPSVVYGSLAISPAASSAIASTVTPTVIYGSVSIAPAASYAVASTVDPTVSVGALIISPAAASAVVSTVDPTVEYGSLSVAPVAAESVAGTVDPTVVQGSLSITPDVSYAVASTVDPTVSAGALIISPTPASAVVSVANPTVVQGNVSVAPTAASAVGQTVDPTVEYGSISVSPAVAEAVASTTDPSVVHGSVTISGAVASAVGSTVDPTTIYGSVSIAPVASYAVASTVNPTVIGGDVVSITPDPASAVASTVDPTTVYGSLALTPSPVSAVASTVDPTVSEGALVIQPAPASAVCSSVDPTTVYGSVSVTPVVSYAVASTIDPVVGFGSTTATPAPASVVASTTDPNTVYGSLAISPSVSYAVVSSVDPTVIYGSVTCTDVASCVVSTVDPTIVYGSLTVVVASAYAVARTVNPIVITGLFWRPIKRFEVAINTEYVTTSNIYESIEFEVELTEILENEVSL